MVKDHNALNLDELLEHDLKGAKLKPIIDLVARHSWWVSPKVYREIQVIYPKTRRKKGTTEKRGALINGVRIWDNQPANHAFWLAIGKNRNRVKNSFVCHIYEDSVWDPEHFTNLANLVAFPKGLQSLSEWTPIRRLLKYHSFIIYGYKGLNQLEPPKINYYPQGWQNQMNHSPSEHERIVNKLKNQRETRPEYRRARTPRDD